MRVLKGIIMIDNDSMNRYFASSQQLVRAEKVIPLGSQTFSKSRTQYPVGVSPLYATKAKGPFIWDVDGNRYVDLVNSLASITLGYADKDVEIAVKKQLKLAVSMSLPGVLESEVAELIVEMVPSAEMVRFGKNGTDATSAAIRLARAYTGRDHIAVCGYHGWQDWYIGSTTRNKGIPESVSRLTHKFDFNDIESLREIIANNPDQISAVIMEPMNSQWPNKGFLEEIRTLTQAKGIILIFDETITGFRFSRGGAQELFGVTPDLSTFGKGLANGFPLSAVVGKRDIMMEMEEIFFSGTFGGELLSLAAAKVVLKKHQYKDITGQLTNIGKQISDKVTTQINENDLGHVLSLSGHDSWRFLNWRDVGNITVNQIKTLFLQEMFRNGVLVLGTHNVSLSHFGQPILLLEKAYTESLKIIAKAVRNDSTEGVLKVEPLVPLFKVR